MALGCEISAILVRLASPGAVGPLRHVRLQRVAHGLRVRALVIAAVFDKSLTQATSARAEQTTGKLGTAGRQCPGVVRVCAVSC